MPSIIFPKLGTKGSIRYQRRWKQGFGQLPRGATEFAIAFASTDNFSGRTSGRILFWSELTLKLITRHSYIHSDGSLQYTFRKEWLLMADDTSDNHLGHFYICDFDLL